MVLPAKYWILAFLVVSLSEDIVCRKSKRNKINSPPPPPLEDQFIKYIPKDVQITAFLQQGQNKTFYTWSNLNNSYLSITVLTCSSEVFWSMDYRVDNVTTIADERNLAPTRKVTDIDIYNFWTQKGLYVINVRSSKASFLHLYVSTVIEFPFDVLQNAHSNLKVIKRRRKRLTVSWNPSLVDPHVTDYCLVVNTRRTFRTLCSAQYETRSVPKEDGPQVLKYDHQHNRRDLSSPKITCVGKRTHFTLNSLEKGQNYFIDVFAVNQQTNLTYPHGATKTKFDTYIKPTQLKDEKLTFANLRKLDGKAEFIYKLDKSTNDTLEFYLIPCGLMDIEVILKYNGTKTKTRIKGFGKIEVPNPIPSKYFLRVINHDVSDASRRASGVKVLATTKPSKIPFPVLPTRTEVHEYISMRKCNSITIGWYASPMKNNARYCIAAKKGKAPQIDKLEMADHCKANYNLKSLGVSYCKEFKEVNREIVMETIGNLQPGESYVVYVSIQKKKGKSLPYDLLQAYTKSECS